jgi:hypothetical protein
MYSKPDGELQHAGQAKINAKTTAGGAETFLVKIKILAVSVDLGFYFRMFSFSEKPPFNLILMLTIYEFMGSFLKGPQILSFEAITLSS